MLTNDEELTLNIDSDSDLSFLCKELIKRGKIILVECLKKQNSVPVEDIFTYEPKKVVNIPPISTSIRVDKCRDFRLCDDWVYIQLFTYKLIMKYLLNNQISNFIRNNAYMFQKFHYLYYPKPSPHIRLRFLLSKSENRISLLHKLINLGNTLLINNYIYDYKFDTYVQELERYGGATFINKTETIFYKDSLNCISHFKANKDIMSGLDLIQFVKYYLDLSDTETLLVFKYFCNEIKKGKFSIQSKKIVRNLVYDNPSKKKIYNTNKYIEIARSLIHMHCNRCLLSRNQELLSEYTAFCITQAIMKREKHGQI